MVSIIFKIEKNDNRGIFYEETSRCLIYLPMHETLDDLYKTISHEVFHFCFDKAGEAEHMDEEMEEKLIFQLQWAEHSL